MDGDENAADVNATKRELIVKNLTFNIDEDAIHAHFEKYGEITNIKLLKRPDGKSKGMGFVEFAEAKDAKKAKDTEHGKLLDGRDLNIEFSEGKPAGDSYGGNQRGGFGGGNRGGYGGNSSGGSGGSSTLFVGNLGFRTTDQSLKRFF